MYRREWQYCLKLNYKTCERELWSNTTTPLFLPLLIFTGWFRSFCQYQVWRAFSFFPPLSRLQDDSSVSSEDMNGAEPTWVAAEQPPVPEPSPPNGDRVSNPTAAVKEEDGKTRLNVLFGPALLLFTSEIWKETGLHNSGTDWCHAGNSLPCS